MLGYGALDKFFSKKLFLKLRLIQTTSCITYKNFLQKIQLVYE